MNDGKEAPFGTHRGKVMLLKDLLEGLEYQSSGSTELEISALIYDSRKAKPGCAFICLCGANADGHLYAQQAVQAGAVAVIAQHEVDASGATVVVVEDILGIPRGICALWALRGRKERPQPRI